MQTSLDGIGIKAVSNLTGVTEFTLRAWEKRYGVPRPERSRTGRRVYKLDEVQKIRLLSALIRRGYSVGEIATHDVARLTELLELSDQKSHTTGPGFATARPASWYVRELLKAAPPLDLLSIGSTLRSAQMRFDARSFLLEVVSPALAEIGSEVAAGRLDVYQEHAISAVLRSVLSALLFSTEQSADFRLEAPIILAAPEGDHHEFGVLIASILSVLGGFRVLYLGPNLPLPSLLRAVQSLRSRLVIMGVSAPHSSLSNADYRDYFKGLLDQLPETTAVWLGGGRVTPGDAIVRSLRPGDSYFASLQELDRRLQTIPTPFGAAPVLAPS